MHSNHFDKSIILGRDFSSILSAIALSPHLTIEAIIGPSKESRNESFRCEPWNETGKQAHSHIFLPRLEAELNRIDPTILQQLNDLGLKFVQGSKRLGDDAPAECRRLFATRWQFNQCFEDIYNQNLNLHEYNGLVKEIKTDENNIQLITLVDGSSIQVDHKTLVVDAMGSDSPIMSELVSKCEQVEDYSSNIVYITQFFKLKLNRTDELPDPLFDCSHDFGLAYITLYPAVDGWFSITICTNGKNKEFIKEIRSIDAFIAFCCKHPSTGSWIQSSDPFGKTRIYINPKNQWNVPVFLENSTPKNYLAAGDALVTMVPNLGANCSFSATHIRLIRDLVVGSSSNLQAKFAAAVHEEQYEFFQSAVNFSETFVPRQYIPFDKSRIERIDKRIKRRIRRSLGLDRPRIIRQLSSSSSL